MIITTITRIYSRSVNTNTISKNAPDSWVKAVAEYSAQIESTDNVAEVSAQIHELCRNDVAIAIKALSDNVRSAYDKAPTVNDAPTPVAPAPAPVPMPAQPEMTPVTPAALPPIYPAQPRQL